jgi:hypothetical protein
MSISVVMLNSCLNFNPFQINFFQDLLCNVPYISGRLPFKPLAPSPAVNKASRKRKLSSSSDSPKAKGKLLKPDVCHVADKVKANDPPHDNEVSSSSEAESGNAKSKSKNNLLDAFIRREDEITSTNDVVDLTDIVDEQEIDENKPATVASPKKSPRKATLDSPYVKLVKLKEKTEEHYARKLVFDEGKASDRENVPSEKFLTTSTSEEKKEGDSDGMVISEDESDSKDDESEQKDAKKESEKKESDFDEILISEDEEDVSKDNESELKDASEESEKSLNDSTLETSVLESDQSEKKLAKTPVQRKRKSHMTASTLQGESGNTSISSIDGTTPKSAKAKRVCSTDFLFH